MGKARWVTNNLKKTYRYLKRNGVRAAAAASLERLLQEREQRDYTYLPPSEEELARQREEAAVWQRPPLFSVAVPAYETDPVFLKELLDSMQAQTWPYWELILADAGSGDGVRKAALERKDERIRYQKLASNEGIAENTNAAILAASGDYIGLLDHDDFLTPDALYAMAAALRESRERGIKPRFLYSDEDKYDAGRYYEPHFKLDFNLDLLLSNNYICHFLVMEAGLMKRLLERPGFDGAQDYDLVLRAVGEAYAEGTAAGRAQTQEETAVRWTTTDETGAFVHIPRVLYHWRCHQASTAANPESKSYAYEAGKRALEDFCAVQGWKASVTHMRHLGFYRVSYEEDILNTRSDLGAVACPLPNVHGRHNSGIYDCVLTTKTDENQPGKDTVPEEGIVPGKDTVLIRYSRLPACFTGPFHRSVLPQDVEAADVRTMQVRPEWEQELAKALAAIRHGEDPVCVSMEFCTRIRCSGQRILWNPDRKERSD